jgi:hypothetical protein
MKAMINSSTTKAEIKINMKNNNQNKITNSQK